MAAEGLVGSRIKTARRKLGLSQLKLAQPELSESYVSLIESGRRTPPAAVVELLAQKLDCSASYLLHGATPEQIDELLRNAQTALTQGQVAKGRTGFLQLLSEYELTSMPAIQYQVAVGLVDCARSVSDLDETIAVLVAMCEHEQVSLEQWTRLSGVLCRCHRRKGDLDQAVRVAGA
ncbi:helix-turn-helix transcriptional regulator, partial [Sphaerisporangium flaviroseum]|uniref:helix-turn-helix domain-containing protein n=1 Tax=Sphaerisporangium flaviroseum TaxID=509199 RepID=UPI0031EA344B